MWTSRSLPKSLRRRPTSRDGGIAIAVHALSCLRLCAWTSLDSPAARCCRAIFTVHVRQLPGSWCAACLRAMGCGGGGARLFTELCPRGVGIAWDCMTRGDLGPMLGFRDTSLDVFGCSSTSSPPLPSRSSPSLLYFALRVKATCILGMAWGCVLGWSACAAGRLLMCPTGC